MTILKFQRTSRIMHDHWQSSLKNEQNQSNTFREITCTKFFGKSNKRQYENKLSRWKRKTLIILDTTERKSRKCCRITF